MTKGYNRGSFVILVARYFLADGSKGSSKGRLAWCHPGEKEVSLFK